MKNENEPKIFLCCTDPDMVVIFVRNSAIFGIFFPVRILRNDKSSLYPKKCYYQVTRMILALRRIALCIKIVFKRVKLQFIWQIKFSADFGEIKMTIMDPELASFLEQVVQYMKFHVSKIMDNFAIAFCLHGFLLLKKEFKIFHDFKSESMKRCCV